MWNERYWMILLRLLQEKTCKDTLRSTDVLSSSVLLLELASVSRSALARTFRSDASDPGKFFSFTFCSSEILRPIDAWKMRLGLEACNSKRWGCTSDGFVLTRSRNLNIQVWNVICAMIHFRVFWGRDDRTSWNQTGTCKSDAWKDWCWFVHDREFRNSTLKCRSRSLSVLNLGSQRLLFMGCFPLPPSHLRIAVCYWQFSGLVQTLLTDRRSIN